VQRKPRRRGSVVEYNLYVNDTAVNFTGRKRKALAINGKIPATLFKIKLFRYGNEKSQKSAHGKKAQPSL
jgi:hypothetical protein